MSFSEDLLKWYDVSRRDLPWRGERDPYRIWLSEIMLQQTRVPTVEKYYARFLKAWPTVESLADAEEEDVLKAWEGLGYYARARNLHAAAKAVTAMGGFPTTRQGLLALPGVGPYAASAIASIAYGEAVPALDGNQARVFSRVLAWERPLKSPFDLIDAAQRLIDPNRPGDFNQAMMDLGSMVCLARKPLCPDCPVRRHCDAFRRDDPESFPRRQPKPPKREEQRTVLLLRAPDGWLVRRRPASGLLSGLYEFPNLPGHLTPADMAGPLRGMGIPEPMRWEPLPEASHVFTHLIWRMRGWQAEVPACPDGWKAVGRRAEWDRLAFPTALAVYRAIAEEALED